MTYGLSVCLFKSGPCSGEFNCLIDTVQSNKSAMPTTMVSNQKYFDLHKYVD